MDNKDQIKGKIEQAVGALTGNEDLKKRGVADERAGDAKKRLDQANAKLDDAVDVLKGKVAPKS